MLPLMSLLCKVNTAVVTPVVIEIHVLGTRGRTVIVIVRNHNTPWMGLLYAPTKIMSFRPENNL